MRFPSCIHIPEPVDWLGLSRLGSPKVTSKDNEDDDIGMEPPRPRSGGRGGVPKELPEPDDWLGSSSRKGKPEKKPTPSTSDQPDDWLGASSGKTDDWLGASSGKTDDWLGASAGKDADWLGVKDGPAAKDSDGDDWLGLSKGKEGKSDDWLGGPEKSKKDSTAASGDYLGLDDPFK